MDFILSLAHFCEIHGPTTVLCTQALPIPCSTCHPALAGESAEPAEPVKPTSPISKDRRLTPGLGASFGDASRCASCCMSVPDQTDHGSPNKPASDVTEPTPLRTKQLIHTCKGQVSHQQEKDLQIGSLSQSSNCSDQSCHTHRLSYVSKSGPVESETYSTLRRATLRALSGEQLPRGQTSGGLFFGDPKTGYTIVYMFRLADSLARGGHRYYALIALAGFDWNRAFKACTPVWRSFENIATDIVERAEHVAARSTTNDSPPERGHVTPISSFLTFRPMDPDGYPRGPNFKPIGIAELVDNDQFFCELHIMFVSILRDLGQMLGGLKVVPEITLEADNEHGSKPTQTSSHAQQNTENGDGMKYSALITPALPTPLCNSTLVMHRQEVTV